MKRGLAAVAVTALLVAAGVVVWTQSSGERSPLGALETSSDQPVTIDMYQGVPRFMQGEVSVDGATPSERSYAFLERHSDLYALDQPQRELEVTEVGTGETFDHVHLRQIQGGVPVYGGELVVHLKDNAVVSTGGAYLADVPQLEPKVEATSALAAAQKSAGVAKGGESKPELIYFDADLLMTPAERDANGLDDATHLAWKVDVNGTDAQGRGIEKRSFVDAQTSAVLLSFDLVETHAAAKSIRIRTAAGNGSMPTNFCRYLGTTEWFDANGALANVAPDAEGQNAFRFVNRTYDYFYDTFHRHSLNNNEQVMSLILDVVDWWLPAPNAAFMPRCGHAIFTDNMATLDIVAHELTHGVTANSVPGGLQYAFQSGAIDESVSDTFGVLIDSANWLIAEGSASTQFRDYSNPRASRQFDPPRGQPDTMPPEVFAANVDNGGVHQNSGILNKAGFLLMQGGLHNRRTIAPIGRVKTAHLWYEVVDDWLTMTSQFQDLRNSMVALSASWAAAEANGFTATDVCRVRNTLAAVGLDPGDADCDGTPDTSETDADNDGISDTDDNCDFVANPLQFDFDNDGRGTHCDDNESLTSARPILREAIERRTEYFQRIEIPVLPCLEKCEPDVPMEITLDVDIPLQTRLFDEEGKVVAEGSSSEPLVFEPKPDVEYSLEILPRELSLSEEQPFELQLGPRP